MKFGEFANLAKLEHGLRISQHFQIPLIPLNSANVANHAPNFVRAIPVRAVSAPYEHCYPDITIDNL